MIRSVWSIVRYQMSLFRGNLLQATLNTLVGVALVTLDLLFVWGTKRSIDVATHHVEGVTLQQALLVILAIMLLRVALGVSARWIRAVLGVRAQNAMRQRIFARLLSARWSDLRRYHSGDLTNRLERDVTDVVLFISESVPTFLTTCLQFAGAFAFLYYMDSTLALIIVCVVPFFVLSSKLYMRRMRVLAHDRRNIESRVQAIVQETLQHVLVVKLLQKILHFQRALAGEQAALYRCTLKSTRYATVSSSLLNIGFSIGYFISFAWGVYSLSTAAITYGAMLAFIQLVGQIQGPVRSLSKFVPVFISSFTATERLMDLEGMKREDMEEGGLLPVPLGLDVRHVSFSYASGECPVFEDFSCKIPPGSVTVILGETGSGKTTLVRLLLALHAPQKGCVTLFDAKGDTFDTSASTRCNFAYVPQGNTLFSGTVRSNLQLGDPKATEDQMREALHTAAADFVFEKERGLDAPCGESGDGFSEGQSQRIAISRALLSARGGVLIFDEATSALDEETERVVLQRVVGRYHDRTLIFVTHRREVLKYADQCIDLNRCAKASAVGIL